MPSMDSGADNAGDVFDGTPQSHQKRPRFDMGREPPPPPPQASPWASVHADILGVVLNFLPCAADRAAVRSVSRHWRAAARGHCLPPPLPVLVLPKFMFSCLSSRGAMTAARRAVVPQNVAGDGDDDFRCVGSSGSWLAGVRPSCENVERGDGECFLVNAFSHEVIHLPRLNANCNASIYNKSIHIVNDNDSDGFVHTANDGKYWNNAVLSATPNSGSKCIVAAIFQYTMSAAPRLALCQAGMTSWYVCRIDCVTWGSDLAFYHGKLYMIWRYIPFIHAFELGEDEHGVNVSSVASHVIHPLPRSKDNFLLRFQMVIWRGKLLLIVRHFDRYKIEPEVVKVEVFALDISTSPYGVTEIHSFDGDCIFVDGHGCKSFSAGVQHVGVQGDLIYFADGCDGVFNYKNRLFDTYVYSIRNGTMMPLAVESPANSGAPPEVNLDVPVWFCPSE